MFRQTELRNDAVEKVHWHAMHSDLLSKRIVEELNVTLSKL